MNKVVLMIILHSLKMAVIRNGPTATEAKSAE